MNAQAPIQRQTFAVRVYWIHMSSKRLFAAAALALGLALNIFGAHSAKAATVNTLIRTDGNAAIYWYNNDGRRYVFPNAHTFHTWFTDGDLGSVTTLSPQELGAIPLGGNVTYRPGARLVKITTDPHVYVVSRYGVLHWITSEAIATQLFGNAWAQQVDDVPDEFFTNYRIGDPIVNPAQYNVSYEYGQTRIPSDNIALPGTLPSMILSNPLGSNNGVFPSYPSYPSTNNQINGVTATIAFSANTVNPGDSVTVTANAVTNSNYLGNSYYQNYTLNIMDSGGNVLATCNNTTSCTFIVHIGWDLGGHNLSYFARVTNSLGQVVNSNTSIIQVRGGANYVSQGTPTISVDATSPTLNSTFTLIANTNNLDPNNGTLSIIDPNGAVVRSCSNATTCFYSYVMDPGMANAMINDTRFHGVYGYYARYTGNNGLTSNSDPVYIHAPSLSGANTVVGRTMSLDVSSSSIYNGSTETLTANVSGGGTGQGFVITIMNPLNAVLKTCTDAVTCSVDQTMLNTGTQDNSITYHAHVVDMNGRTLDANSPQITIHGQGNGSLSGYRLSLSADVTTVHAGDKVAFTANLTQISGASAGNNAQGFRVTIYDNLGNALNTCTNAFGCSMVSVMNQAVSPEPNPETRQYTAVATDSVSGTSLSASSPTITILPTPIN